MEVKQDARSLIERKLGWKREITSSLRLSELKIILALIKKHDEAEKRLEGQEGRLSTVV